MAAKQLAESFLNIVKGPRSVGPFPSGTSRLPLDLLSTMNKLARIPGQRAPRSVYDTRIHPIRLLALGPLNETPQDVPLDVLALVNELDTEFRAFNNADVYESVVKESPFFAQNNISVPKESDPEYAVDWDKLEATATDKHSFNLAKEVSQTVREAVRIIENDHRLCPYELEAETILGELVCVSLLFFLFVFQGMYSPSPFVFFLMYRHLCFTHAILGHTKNVASLLMYRHLFFTHAILGHTKNVVFLLMFRHG